MNSLTSRTVIVFSFLILLTGLVADWLPSSAAVSKEQASAEPTFAGSIIAYSSRANDLVYHAPSGKIYASIPGGPAEGNSIARIDPATGVIEKTVWVGSEPNKLRLAGDGSTLYVGLDGARAIRAFDLVQEVPGTQFNVGSTISDGPLQIVDFAVAPNNPQLIAVSRDSESSSGPRGVAVFDNGIKRANSGGESDAVTFAGSDSLLVGSSFYSGDGLAKFTIDQSGISAPAAFNATAKGRRLVYSSGRIYTTFGHIVDSVTGALLGTFPLPPSILSDRPFVIDSSAKKAFYVAKIYSGFRIDAFDLETFVLIGSVEFEDSMADPRSIVRWGTNGVAVGAFDGPTRLIQSDLIGHGPIMPSAELPVPSLVTESPAVIRRIDVRNNDLLFNHLDNRFYLSVPGSAGLGLGNTITRLNPVTENIESSVFIGSEPSVLALSEDGSTLQVSLNGANAIRSFDTVSGTPGLQFTPANNGNLTRDIVVLPGTTQSIVVSAGEGKLAAYDSGVKRPIAPNVRVGPLAKGPSSVVYGFNNMTTGFNLYTMSVTAQGLNILSDQQNLIYPNVRIKYANGLLYTSNGSVLDPETGRVLGRSPTAGSNKAIEVDLDLRQVYVAYQDRIDVFNVDTYNQVGSIRLPAYSDAYYPVTKIVRWGRRGLAVRVGSASGGFLLLVESDLIKRSTPFDFDGDGKADPSVFRPEGQGVWYVNGSQTGFMGAVEWGISTDRLVPADYDGDGKTDVAVYRDGTWWVLNSNGGGITQTDWGIATDIPVPADYDGDGKADLAVYRGGTWWILYANGSGYTQAEWGIATDKPVPADYDGDGKADVAVYRNGTWWVIYVNGGSGSTDWGIATDIPVPADYDGDSKTDIAVYRDGDWWVLHSNGGGYTQTNWGIATDKPVPADYDGDGKADLTVYRDGDWWTMKSNGAGITQTNWGIATDIPIPRRQP